MTDSSATFNDLPLSDEVRGAILEDLGWDEPTPVQLAAYPPAIEKKDLIVQSRTGTGKTGAFGIPLVDKLVSSELAVQALVLAPTRELALQSARELARLGSRKGIRTAAVYGGAPIQKQVDELKAGAQIVSGTPGRVLDHLGRGTLDPTGLQVLVLDEADEMLSMGFAKEINAIFEMLPATKQTLLFSATVDDAIERMAKRHMSEPVFLGLSSDQVGATTLDHFVYFVSGKARAQDLVKVLENEDPPSAIIFCNTKAETESVAAALQHSGFNADWINGDLPQRDREKLMARTRSGDLRYLVATDVAARGIDISHLTHVINYTFPESVEQYIHRSGRTGRAGKTGVALSLVSPQELGSLYYLRLRFKIFPIERSLPSKGEEETRKEADRIGLLEQAASKHPGDGSMRLARRLLTHENAEVLVAGLLSSFFGFQEEDTDERAAAERRAKPGPIVKDEVSKEQPPPRKPRRSRERTAADSDQAEQTPKSKRPRREGRDGAPLAKEASAPDESATSQAPDNEDMTRLYISVGRKDGARAGQLARFFREEGKLERADVGRIRIRDKHAFVEVRSEHAETVSAALSGKTLLEREITVEPARPDAST